MDTLFRQRRMTMPKRASELVALLAVSSTLFLFLHTRDLTSRLHQMEGRLNEDDYQISARVQTDHVPALLHDFRTMDSMPKPSHLERFGSKRILEQESGEDDNAENRLSSGPEEQILDPSELNNTRKAGLDVLFFNRVPKVGSQTFMELLRRLAVRNSFGFNRDAVQRMETIRLSPTDQELLAGYVSSFAAPSAYVKHVCYTNFTKFNYPSPIYINVVRDPVERVISWYYYIRAPWYYVERKRAFPDLPLPDTDWLKKDFETCVLSGDPECRYTQGETRDGIGDHRRQTLFFCGHDHDCLPFNSAASLARAKAAVEAHYAVVGVLESFNATLRALQHYVPAFFQGAHQLYWEEMRPYSRINRNAFKPRVSERVKAIVRANFTREIDFYEFCKQRLHRQVRALKLTGENY